MDCLPIAVGAMSFFIYMQRRNQTGFQGPSLSRRKLSQNLPPDPWVLLFSGSIDMCIQGSHWQRAKNRIILCLVRSVELNVEFSLSEVHENEMMWVNMGVEWKFFNSSDKKGRKGNQQCRITVIFWLLKRTASCLGLLMCLEFGTYSSIYYPLEVVLICKNHCALDYSYLEYWFYGLSKTVILFHSWYSV